MDWKFSERISKLEAYRQWSDQYRPELAISHSSSRPCNLHECTFIRVTGCPLFICKVSGNVIRHHCSETACHDDLVALNRHTSQCPWSGKLYHVQIDLEKDPIRFTHGAASLTNLLSDMGLCDREAQKKAEQEDKKKRKKIRRKPRQTRGGEESKGFEDLEELLLSSSSSSSSYNKIPVATPFIADALGLNGRTLDKLQQRMFKLATSTINALCPANLPKDMARDMMVAATKYYVWFRNKSSSLDSKEYSFVLHVAAMLYCGKPYVTWPDQELYLPREDQASSRLQDLGRVNCVDRHITRAKCIYRNLCQTTKPAPFAVLKNESAHMTSECLKWADAFFIEHRAWFPSS